MAPPTDKGAIHGHRAADHASVAGIYQGAGGARVISLEDKDISIRGKKVEGSIRDISSF